LRGQIVEINPAPRVLSLQGDLIFENTTLLAQSEEALPASEEQSAFEIREERGDKEGIGD
jgi:hypothetical protein